MAAIDEAILPAVHRRTAHLLPLSSCLPSSTDRHFEQYLIDHHHYPKLPSISRPAAHRPAIETKNLLSAQLPILPIDSERRPSSVNRLLNSEQYRRSHARLIEYRQHSKIPGVALKITTPLANQYNELSSNTRNEIILPLKEVLIETARTKQQTNADDVDFADDDSVFSHDSDRRRRAKHWIKEHQFFFTEFQ